MVGDGFKSSPSLHFLRDWLSKLAQKKYTTPSHIRALLTDRSVLCLHLEKPDFIVVPNLPNVHFQLHVKCPKRPRLCLPISTHDDLFLSVSDGTS